MTSHASMASKDIVPSLGHSRSSAPRLARNPSPSHDIPPPNALNKPVPNGFDNLPISQGPDTTEATLQDATGGGDIAVSRFQDITVSLQDITAIRGVGALIMAHVPLLQRLRLRPLCSSFRSAVDESLESQAEVDGEQLLAHASDPEAWGALSWLLTKCPRVTALRLDSWKGHDHGWGGHFHEHWGGYGVESSRVGRGVVHGEGAPQGHSPGDASAAIGAEMRARARAQGVLRQVSTTWQGLEVLTLEGNVDVTDEGTRTVALKCPRLRRVHLAQCRAIRDATVVAVAGTAARQLEHLNVQGCLQLSDISMLTVARRCPSLTHLTVAGCISVSDASVREIASRCAGLRHLDVSWCERVTDAGVLAVAERCAFLEHLDVAMCSYVTDGSISAVARGCPALTWLCAGRCAGVTDASIVAIGRSCPRLAHLELTLCTGVTDASVLSVGAHCPALTYLDVSACKVTDEGLAALVTRRPQGPCGGGDGGGGGSSGSGGGGGGGASRSAQGPHRAESLRSAAGANAGIPGERGDSGNGVPVGSDNSDSTLGAGAEVSGERQAVVAAEPSVEATQAGPERLGHDLFIPMAWSPVAAGRTAGCQLEELYVGYCDKVTDVGISVVAAHCPRLRRLDVAGCGAVSDAGIRAVACSCRVLEHLSAAMCENVTDEGICAVGAQCGRLRGLDVAYSDVTDDSIEVIARGCPGLTDLNVAQCVGVTERSIRALVENGIRLTCLGSDGCPGIRYEALSLLMSDCRRLG
eukprot:jgi/Mesvir1/11260/Mv01063-RA.1